MGDQDPPDALARPRRPEGGAARPPGSSGNGSADMRVLVFTSMFPRSRHEGRGKAVLRRTAALAERCEVKAIAPQLAGNLPEHEWLDGVEVFRPRWRRIPKLGVFLDGHQLGRLAARAAAGLGDSFDFDLIDSHWIYPDGYGAVCLGRRLGKPVVLNGRGSDVNRHCFRWPHRVFARRALKRAAHVIAVARPLKERLVAAGVPPDRVTVVHNGIDTALFRRGDRAAARAELGLPADGLVLLSVGALVEGKGFEHLVGGLAGLPAGSQARLYVAGPGPGGPALERHAQGCGVSERVTLLGSLPQDELPRWYQAADFFCFGSLREGCPNVVLEAQACGTPVLSTPVGAVPDLLADERCGILFAPGSPEAFAAALAAALDRRWDRDLIAQQGGRRSWANVADEVLAVFRRVLARQTEAS